MAIETVTSENREEYMEKKLAEKAGKKPKEHEKDDQFERIKKHPKYAKLVIALGKKGAMDALLKELNDKQ